MDELPARGIGGSAAWMVSRGFLSGLEPDLPFGEVLGGMVTRILDASCAILHLAGRNHACRTSSFDQSVGFLIPYPLRALGSTVGRQTTPTRLGLLSSPKLSQNPSCGCSYAFCQGRQREICPGPCCHETVGQADGGCQMLQSCRGWPEISNLSPVQSCRHCHHQTLSK